jgi:hypothetical protein
MTFVICRVIKYSRYLSMNNFFLSLTNPNKQMNVLYLGTVNNNYFNELLISAEIQISFPSHFCILTVLNLFMRLELFSKVDAPQVLQNVFEGSEFVSNKVAITYNICCELCSLCSFVELFCTLVIVKLCFFFCISRLGTSC